MAHRIERLGNTIARETLRAEFRMGELPTDSISEKVHRGGYHGGQDRLLFEAIPNATLPGHGQAGIKVVPDAGRDWGTLPVKDSGDNMMEDIFKLIEENPDAAEVQWNPYPFPEETLRYG